MTTDRYSITEIRGFLLDSPAVIQGVSPDVYDQNRDILPTVEHVAQNAGPNILGVQILGSRKHGTSTIGSDLDLAILSFDDRDDAELLERDLRTRLGGIDIDTDDPTIFGCQITPMITTDPRTFIARQRLMPMCSAGLFEAGIYTSDNRVLAGLAVTSVLGAQGERGSAAWKSIREAHAVAYLGTLPRICAKLAGRLHIGERDVQEIITPALMEERYKRFGLPKSMADYRAPGLDWMAQNEVRLCKERGYRLFQEVEAVINNNHS